jgi:hypothetical protein
VRLSTLIKKLEHLKAVHGGGIKVCANTLSLRESCNDVWQIVDVTEAKFDTVNQVDGDGFRKENKDGSEHVRRCVVLS